MRILERMIDSLRDEIEGARDYAEKFIECKARQNIPRANKYREMANDEIKHAEFLRDMYVQDAEGIKRVHTLTDVEEDRWTHACKMINDEIAAVKMLLGNG